MQKGRREFRNKLIGEYTGSLAPTISGEKLILRNRTRIYETEKGHLSYIITEHITDAQQRISKKETYVGLVTGELRETEAEPGLLKLHLSPLDRPYHGDNKVQCQFRFEEDFNSFFLIFRWREKGEEIQFSLKKASTYGSGRRRRPA